ncbi:hypothetical protein EYZ11_006838 [Aspergillus tanneri]|uniref:Uncharacterized protein n=1 Tax=Aspergillus tanneri TaxID=1220188 RepID=A0A4V3UP47_9EURO|nr:uncharacterized protein ATNIH1004_011778 [Aspergillus tanneri]KAA8641642.1 hypothetical protein ATNIH1004_011778 [Aspergillus tanneri]THC93694.1 hypothetical protein EYZ11_006838 [Aspergillus tanneri]
MLAAIESPTRRKMREALKNITQSIKGLEVDKFDLQQLKHLNIRVDSLVLDESSPHKPSYFAPYPGHLVPNPDDDALGGPYNGLDDETEHSFTRPIDRAYVMNIHLSSYISYCDTYAKGERPPWTSGCVGDYPFKGLYKHDQPEFGCYHITDLNGPTYPHVKAVMYNNLVAMDSTILYGELLPILRIMLTQLWKARFIRQMVSPVLILSLMGLKARVIEAYFRDHTLILRPTKIYDFTHGNNAAFKTFVQWYMGQPIGNTVEAF